MLRQNLRLVAAMSAGSVGGTVVGGVLAGAVDQDVLVPLLGVLLLVSAVKVWRHDR